MAFNINRFKNNINDLGYLKNNHFEIYVTLPPVMQNVTLNNSGRGVSTSNINKILKYRIDQVRTPSIGVISTDVSRYGIGPTQKMPYNSQFLETTFSVLVDKNADLYQFWYNWVRSIFEFNGSEANSGTVGFASNRFARYIVDYKEHYSTTMQIVIYDNVGRVVQKINMLEAFPTSVRELNLGWGDTQNLMYLQVSITYTEFTIEGSTLSETNTTQSPKSNYSASATSQVITA